MKILITLLLAMRASSEYCNDHLRKGPYVLSTEMESSAIIGPTTVSFIKQAPIENMAHGIVAYRGYWKSYCYQGGALDRNSGCLDSYTATPPDLDEAIQWIRKNKCLIGREYVDAWGSDANKCNQDTDLNTWVRTSEITKRSTNNNFAYHTCNKSWRCGAHEIELPVVNTGKELMVIGPNHEEKRAAVGLFSKNKDSIIYISKIPELQNKTVSLNCSVAPNKYELSCHDPESNFHFKSTKNSVSCFKHACYYSGTPENHKPMDIEGPDFWKSASIGDVYQLMSYVRELEYRGQQNEMILKTQIIRLERTVLKLINSLALIDDRLIGTVLTQPMRTKFITPTYFYASPCTGKIRDTNCAGNKIFKSGRWMKNQKNSSCTEIRKASEIYLFKNMSLWWPDFVDSSIEGIDNDLDGWSFYAQEKNNLIDTMMYTKYGGKGTSIIDLAEWPEGALNTVRSLIGFGLLGTYGLLALSFFIVYTILKKFL